MYSSGDLERFYFKYQTEVLPHGQSLRSFCLSNKVPYNIFSKWYRDTHRKRPSKLPLKERPFKSPLKGDFPVQPFSFKGNKRGAILGPPPLRGIRGGRYFKRDKRGSVGRWSSRLCVSLIIYKTNKDEEKSICQRLL